MEEPVETVSDPRQSDPTTHVELALLEHLIGPPGGGRLLDIGCGRGRLSGALSERSTEYVGIDTDPRALREARAKLGGAPTGHLVRGRTRTAYPSATARSIRWSPCACTTGSRPRAPS